MLKRMIRLFTGMVLFLFSLGLTGQSLTGRTLDENGEPLPFATIKIKGTTKGTTSNLNGKYQMRLKQGDYTIVVQHIGYKKIEKQVTIGPRPVVQDFTLKPEVLQLNEVVVSSDAEDPAYRVIRKAIEKRKFYKEEVEAYSCDVYIKGMQRLDSFPDKILGVDVTLDTGIVYLSESISRLKFEQPNNISERMISSKVSGDNQAFSWNRASEMLINLYENNFDIEGLSERDFVSPISNNAFLFYDYELQGVIQEGDLLINKIKLLPKRENDPVFDGYIYIIEDQWRIHSADVLLTKSRGIEFVDSLELKQVYAEADYGVWMPITQRFSFHFNVFKIQGSGYFNAVYSDYDVQPNPSAVKTEKQVTDLFDKDDFNNEIMYVEEGSNEKDSAYWQSVRPIPLSQIEMKDYDVKDSIRLVKESKVYKDSVDAERNKLTVGKLLLSGYTVRNSYEGKRFSFPTLLSSLQFNAVEGLATDLGFTYTRLEDERTKWQISPSVRYGFKNEKFHARAAFRYRMLDKKFTSFRFGGGRYVSQLNENNPVRPFFNTVNALVYGKNLIKLFEKGFVYGSFQQELVNGLFFVGRLEYANRSMLFNNSNYSFREGNVYAPNVPVNAELGDTSFPLHQALVANFTFRVRFGQKYQTRPDRRIIYKPKTPQFYIRYQKGIPAFGSDVDYDQWEVSMTDDMEFGLVGTSQYYLSVGGFFNTADMSFVDYQHFNGNRLSYTRANGLRQFQLLDYYQYSTNNTYLEGHYEHHFNEFILNKIPLIRKLNWQTVASAHYLSTNALDSYVEVGIGIEHIFKFLRIDYFRSFTNGSLDGINADQAIRLGFGF